MADGDRSRRRSGTLEWVIVVTCAAVAVVAGFVARHEWRRAPSQPEPTMSAPLRAILATLKALLYGWLIALIALVRSLPSLCRRRRGMTNDEEHERKRARTWCVPIHDPAYVRPDPLIYDQYYLLELGLNVTWDNPDRSYRDPGW